MVLRPLRYRSCWKIARPLQSRVCGGPSSWPPEVLSSPHPRKAPSFFSTATDSKQVARTDASAGGSPHGVPRARLLVPPVRAPALFSVVHRSFARRTHRPCAPRELSRLYVLAFEHSGNVLVSSHLTLLIAVPWKVCFSNAVLG